MVPRPAGLRIDELASAVGATPRAIRFWVRRGVLTAPTRRGRESRYAVDSADRIRAMRTMRAEGLELREIRRRLANATPGEIAAWGRVREPEPAGAAAATDPPAGDGARPVAEADARPAPVEHAEAWQRLALLPGLELHYRTGSTDFVRRIAVEIAQRYGTGTGAPPSST